MKQVVPAVLFAALILYGQWINLDSPHSSLAQFGWEYGNIAESLARQGTFADAMARGSGPTAWMPPVLCGLYAAAFCLAGVRTGAALALLATLKACALAACFGLFLRMAYNRWGRAGVAGGLAFTAAWLILEDYRVCGELDDSWLVNCLSLLSLWSLLRLQEGRGDGREALLSVVLPLAVPTLAAAYFVTVALLGLQARRRGERWRSHALLLALGVTAALGWGARHAAVMGRFYPVKSNFWFDLVEANLWDDDGVLTDSFLLTYHPVSRNPVQERYIALGERRFLDEARAEAESLTVRNWLWRCARRLSNATWRLQPELDFALASGLTAAEVTMLQPTRWLYTFRGQPYWMFLDRPEAEVVSELRALPLLEGRGVLRSRRNAVDYHRKRCAKATAVWWQFHFTLLPALACVTLLVQGRAAGRTAVLLYGAYLLPYILVQHYCRYQVSVPWLQAFLCLEAWMPQRIQLMSSQPEV